MTGAHIFHVIKDPVHGTMQFTSTEDRWVKPFIDSTNFQRLRHIKQLGMGDFIFPGAVHSRFNHCLGCCYVACQIAYKIGLADEERQKVMIACLLHDIGHGPFSHVFEDIFQEKIRHEDWTPYFLMDYCHEKFFLHYNRLNPRYPLTEEKFADIADMIMHKSKSKNILADIVSSQLDADRLDYLLRDSHFCGVRYGEFDFRWMLHCMAIVQHGESERLGITHKGIGVVEHYLMARRLMTRNIYQAQKKLALEYFLVRLLASLAQNLEKNPDYSLLCQTRLGKFLLAVNQFNQALALDTNQQTKLKQEFLKQQYIHYKELCDYDVFALIKQIAEHKNKNPETQLAQRLLQRQMPKIIRIHSDDLCLVTEKMNNFKQSFHSIFQDWQINIIQTPHRAYSGNEDPILVVNEHGAVQPIHNFSFMIDALSDKLEHIAFLCIDQTIAEDPHVQDFLQGLLQKMPLAI